MDGPGSDDNLDFDSLKKLCREISTARMKAHLGGEEVSFREGEEDDVIDENKNVGKWLSLIFVSSHVVKMGFQSNFTFDQCKHFTATALEKNAEDVSKGQMEDFIKEFCNLTAGALKKGLEKEGFSSLISLPLLTRGQDDVFFKGHPADTGAPLNYQDSWEILYGESFITCNIFFEIYDKDNFSKIILGAFGAEDEEEGDIDFF